MMQWTFCIIVTMEIFLLISNFVLGSSDDNNKESSSLSATALPITTFGEEIFSDDVPDFYAIINVTYKTEEGGWTSEKSEAGRYGGNNIGAAYGYLVHVSSEANPNDHTGCQLPFRSTRSDRKLPRPGEPWIALIKRGRCNFEMKVEHAYRSNASGVLVYNDRESTSLDKMKLSTDSGRDISAIFTYKLKGEQLAKLLENDSEVIVHITAIKKDGGRNATINRTSVLFVSITFIVLMIISLAWLVFYYVQRFRYIHAKDRLSRRLCNAAKKALSKIPTKSIKPEDKEVQEGECCAICIEPYKISEVLRMLPCQHEFHKNCIDPWLLEHRTCPMCKMDILKHYGFVFTGSQESILHMDIEEVVGLGGSSDSQESDSPHRGGVSPLPQIRAVILSENQRPYTDSIDLDQSSRASTPDERTPSLSTRRAHHAIRKDFCANCIAAAAATVLVNATQGDNVSSSSSSLSRPSTSGGGTNLENSDTYVQQALISEDDKKRVQLVQQDSGCGQENLTTNAVVY